jgi:hypothetical protein
VSARNADRIRAAARRLGLSDGLAARIAAHTPTVVTGSGPTVVACDLDRTLIYSAAALGLNAPDAEAPALVVAEVYRGAPVSFLTRVADRLLTALCTVAEVVPTTTRTVAQYRRIRLADHRPAYAVTSNGGRILVDGRADGDWSVRTATLLAGACAPLEQVADRMRRAADPGWLRRLHTAEDLFCYAVVDRAKLPCPVVADLTGWCAERGWTVSVQGRKLYCVPRLLTKSAAVEEVRRRAGAARMVAAGDSLLDAELLAAADIAVRPAHGELEEARWNAPHLMVTAARGVLGGEEVVVRLLAAILAAA